MSEKKLVFEALAFIDNYETSPSMQGMGKSNKTAEIYLKNAVVSLVSIKRHNPDADVALVTNIDIDERWEKYFKENEVMVWNCAYQNYSMSAEIVYSLSYYKLCAFDYVLKNTKYDKICFVDCDTFCVKSFTKVWEEVDSAFLMIPNDKSIDATVRKEIIGIYSRMQETGNKSIPHISSGFIAGVRTDLEKVLERCQKVYDELRTMSDVFPKGGDEVIWSLALADYEGKMYCPRAYVLLSNVGARSYWVDKESYEDENIVIWHLPTEKRYALIWAYEKFKRKGTFPTVKQMAKACRIRHIHSRFTVLSLKVILMDKTVVKRNLKKIGRKVIGKSKKVL